MKNTFEIWLEIKAWDKDGKVIHQEKRQSQSPVKQFLQLLLIGARDGAITVKDTGGAGRGPYPSAVSPAHWIRLNAGLNDGSYGIVIGTGSTSVDILDYCLEAKIAQGSGAGQMIHNAVVIDSAVAVSDPDATFSLYRNFNNNSGGGITVKETGLYATGGGYTFLIVRDVPTEVAVLDGGGCYVKYTLKISE